MWIPGSKRLWAEEYYTACKAPRKKAGVRLRKIKIKSIQGNGGKKKHKSKEYKRPEKAQVKILSLHAGLINEALSTNKPGCKDWERVVFSNA